MILYYEHYDELVIVLLLESFTMMIVLSCCLLKIFYYESGAELTLRKSQIAERSLILRNITKRFSRIAKVISYSVIYFDKQRTGIYQTFQSKENPD